MKIDEKTGKTLGWLGIALGVIGFFWASIWMGVLSIVAGVVGLTSPTKTLNWVAVVCGVIALIIGIV